MWFVCGARSVHSIWRNIPRDLPLFKRLDEYILNFIIHKDSDEVTNCLGDNHDTIYNMAARRNHSKIAFIDGFIPTSLTNIIYHYFKYRLYLFLNILLQKCYKNV